MPAPACVERTPLTRRDLPSINQIACRAARPANLAEIRAKEWLFVVLIPRVTEVVLKWRRAVTCPGDERRTSRRPHGLRKDARFLLRSTCQQ